MPVLLHKHGPRDALVIFITRLKPNCPDRFTGSRIDRHDSTVTGIAIIKQQWMGTQFGHDIGGSCGHLRIVVPPLYARDADGRYTRTMPLTRDDIARRAACELQDGFYVNLGIGMPTLVANHVPDGMTVWLQSENGLLGMGPFPTDDAVDADLINAGKQTVTADLGASFFGSHESFAMIRGGHIDLAILGAMELSEEGDIANWMIPGKLVKGMGGAMDLVAGVRRVVVMMDHCNKRGEPKLLPACTLPLTGVRCIDMVITDLCVLEMDPQRQRFVLTELAPDVTAEEVLDKTSAEIIVESEPATVS